MKERDREENNRSESVEIEEIKKNIPPLPFTATSKAGLAQLLANISWTPWWHKIHDTFATPDHLYSGFCKLCFSPLFNILVHTTAVYAYY